MAPERPTEYQKEKGKEGDTETSRVKRQQESQGSDDPAGTPDSARQQEAVSKEAADGEDAG
jgi:hypothetical protein